MQQRSVGSISPARAAEELAAVQSVAAAAGDPALKSRLGGYFFGRPLVRRVLADAVSRADPKLPVRLAGLEARADTSASVAAPAVRSTPSPGKSVHEPIGEEELAVLVQHLSGGFDPLDTIFYPEMEHLTNIATAVIAEASGGTGVRPVEWLGASLAVEINGQRSEFHRVYQAALEEDPPPDEQANRPGFLAHARRLLGNILESGPVWLEVRSAKGNWLRRHGLSAIRSIGWRGQRPR